MACSLFSFMFININKIIKMKYYWNENILNIIKQNTRKYKSSTQLKKKRKSFWSRILFSMWMWHHRILLYTFITVSYQCFYWCSHLCNKRAAALIYFWVFAPLLLYVVKAFFHVLNKKLCPPYSLIPSCAFIR